MIPYILALAGGYLLGNATDLKFAEGGAISGVTDMGVRYRYTKFDNPYTGNGYKYVIFGTTFGGYKFNYVTDKILSEKEINSFYIDNVETSSQNADGGMMAKGGSVKEKAIYHTTVMGKTPEEDEGYWENYENVSYKELQPKEGRYKGYKWVSMVGEEGYWEKDKN